MGRGVKIAQHFVDVIYGSPQRQFRERRTDRRRSRRSATLDRVRQRRRLRRGVRFVSNVNTFGLRGALAVPCQLDRTDGRTDRASGHSMQAVGWNVLLSLRVLSTISRERSDSAACDALSLTAINHSLSVFL